MENKDIDNPSESTPISSEEELNAAVQTVYDSERFIVLHLKPRWDLAPTTLLDGHTPAPELPRLGFEIVDKQHGREVYLDGAWAEIFGQQIRQWQTHMPSRQEVEDTLEGYAALAQNPVRIH